MPQVKRTENVKQPIKVRTRHAQSTAKLPYPWNQAIQSLQLQTESLGTSWFRFEVPIVPLSLNSQYIRTKKGFQYGIAPAILKLREMTKEILREMVQWRPEGAITAVILFHSPLWINKQNYIREMDVDNKIKSVLDAWQNATGIGDERVWSVMAGKIQASEKKTSVYLFDMGDIIDAI